VLGDLAGESDERVELLGRVGVTTEPVQRQPVELAHRGRRRHRVAQRFEQTGRVALAVVRERVGCLDQTLVRPLTGAAPQAHDLVANVVGAAPSSGPTRRDGRLRTVCEGGPVGGAASRTR
jgi:hypothetical protein